VRVITNRSSGKMGYALAQAAMNRGAEVILVTGPTGLTPPPASKIIRVESATKMRHQVLLNLPGASLVIMAAAVSDYRVQRILKIKVKKTKGGLTLRLEKNPDILGEVLKRKKPGQTIIGFAAETDHLEKHALAKWKRKPCDLLVANRVGREGTGFNADQNEMLVFSKKHSKPIHFKRDLKSRLAEKLLDLV
jgi:phosphopantothenoylcysteine decarboxylase/phosphopantothenate--cysteine ligase